jgi:hypothetical protein
VAKWKADDVLTVLNCWECSPDPASTCRKCGGTGKVFWVDGRAYPYTPKGEKLAKSNLESCV